MTEPPQGAAAAAPPPGWYPDPHGGGQRWWDGNAWGPLAPDSSGISPGTSTALSVVSHLGIFVFGVVAPLVIYLTAGKDDADVRHHAREALNFQITFLIGWIVGMSVVFFSVVGSFASSSNGPPAAFFLVFFVLFGTYFVAAGFSIYGAVQAGRHRRWRYPVSLRLVGRNEQSTHGDQSDSSAR